MADAEEIGTETVQRKKRLKPADCGKHIRKRLAESFDEIVNGFVKEAKGGSCHHLKFICELLESEPKGRSRAQVEAEKMLADWKKPGRAPLLRGVDGKFVKTVRVEL